MRSVFTLFIFLITGCLQAQTLRPKAPNIVVPAINGDTLQLSALKGKVVLVDFWASWCQPCRQSNRNLVLLYNKYHDMGFEILSLSLDTDPQKCVKAATEDQMVWPQANLYNGWQSGIVKTWDVRKLPSSFLINSEGEIVATGLTYGVLNSWLSDLLPKHVETK